MRYFNPAIEELFDQGKAIADPEERKKIYERIMQLAILDDTPVAKIQTMEIAWRTNDKVADFGLLAKGYPNWYAWQWLTG